MRIKYIFLTLLLAVALVWVVTAVAADMTVEETNLLPPEFAEVYEVNLGSDGYLYLSDNSSLGDLRRVNPVTGDYTRYQRGAPVLDAKPDRSDNIWWVNGASSFNRLDLEHDQLTTWDLPDSIENPSLRGLDFDDQGRLWMTEFFGTNSRLYRFDLALSELCTYTISGANSYSYYILHDNGKLWLGNWDKKRIYRVDPAGGRADYWNISGTDAKPKGLALDASGNLWWADQGLGALGRLEPDNNRMTLYSLPGDTGDSPQVINIRPEGVWYTENLSGTVGLLDPAIATGETSSVISGTNMLTSQCDNLQPVGVPIPLNPTEGTFLWDSYTLTSTVDSGGWLVYQLPTDPGDVKPEAYGLSYASSYLWVSDQGRQKLLRMLPQIPAITIQKHTEDQDADAPPGPLLQAGDTVNWEYIVNNGAVPLTNVEVTDNDPSVVVDCPKDTLAPEETMTCTAAGTVQTGQYANLGTVSGSSGDITVEASDPSHYFGESPQENIYLPLVLK